MGSVGETSREVGRTAGDERRCGSHHAQSAALLSLEASLTDVEGSRLVVRWVRVQVL